MVEARFLRSYLPLDRLRASRSTYKCASFDSLYSLKMTRIVDNTISNDSMPIRVNNQNNIVFNLQFGYKRLVVANDSGMNMNSIK